MAISDGDVAQSRVLVTGASGFLGSEVMRQLRAAGGAPVGLSRRAPGAGPGGAHEAVDLVTDDLEACLARVRPDVIIHCAGAIGEPRDSAGWARSFAGNFTATERVLAAAAARDDRPRIVLVSTAAIYAALAPGQPALDEDAPWRPASRYGVAKAAATMLANLMTERGELEIAIAVPFNIIGPGQPDTHVPQAFIARLREAPEVLDVGDLSAVRDWVDVRDAARALIGLGAPAVPGGIYNVASGRGIEVREVLDRVIALSGLAPEIRANAAFAGHSVVSRSIGNSSRLHEITGWEPEYSLDESLRSMFD